MINLPCLIPEHDCGNLITEELHLFFLWKWVNTMLFWYLLIRVWNNLQLLIGSHGKMHSSLLRLVLWLNLWSIILTQVRLLLWFSQFLLLRFALMRRFFADRGFGLTDWRFNCSSTLHKLPERHFISKRRRLDFLLLSMLFILHAYHAFTGMYLLISNSFDLFDNCFLA